LFKNEEPITLSFHGVPKDAEIAGFRIDETTRTLVIALESETFPDIPEGQPFEPLSVTVTQHSPFLTALELERNQLQPA
jgi:hypothetical protein